VWAGRHVVLGVSGGIACYKSCILARRLTEAGARVDVVLTRAAAEFVRPLTFEDYVGQAVLGKKDPRLGYYPECAVRYAQDVSFLYASEVLGRDKALARIDRLYGKKTRDRVAADVSLDRDVLDLEAGERRDERIRDLIADTGARDLIDRRDKGQEQLESLEDFSALPLQYVPEQAGERIAILRYFLSRASQELALRPEPADAGRQEAQQAFEKWVDGGAKSVKGKASK